MKLNISENIRSLRKAANMTQEQLAEKLGVSYQSVSRWENDNTYPDMEFLPVLSSIFGVTVDELLGCDKIRRNKQLEKKIQDFGALCSSENTTGQILLPLLRELRNDCLPAVKVCEQISCLFTRVLNGYPEIKKDPDIIKELRETAEELLSRPIPQWLRDSVVYNMAHLEDETYIGSFLENNATQRDLSADTLLLSRYQRNGNWDKAELFRQKKLYGMVNDMVFGMLWKRYDHREIGLNMKINDLVIGFLHDLCDVNPESDHPVTGNGTVDIFFKHRLTLGFRMAAYYATIGECEKAFIVLEDTVSMIEKFIKLPNGTDVITKSVYLDNIIMRKENRTDDNGQFWIRFSDDNIGVEHSIRLTDVLFPLTETAGWNSFNAIRSDPRFTEYVSRVKALFGIEK